MVNNNYMKPMNDEMPSHFAGRLGVLYTTAVDQKHKKKNGQFFTPKMICFCHI